MRDEVETRMWFAHHEQFSRDVGALLTKLAEVFRKLNRIEYRAPWRPSRPEGRCPR